VIGDAAGEKKSVARRSTGLDYSSRPHPSDELDNRRQAGVNVIVAAFCPS
jgi:hypothetical protein